MKMNFRQFKLPVYAIVIFLGLIIFSVFVRAQDLGYSIFQGDEVNTIDFLYEMKPGFQGTMEYLMSQKRGPIQYLINITNVAVFGYNDEWQIRLPYLVFSVIAIFSLYMLAKKIYDPSTALITATLMSINGLFIAFGRITQYQSVMYCVIPFGIMLFIKALNAKSKKLILYSGLIMSFAFLTHYDTLSVVPFFIAGFVASLVREIYADKKELNLGIVFHEIKAKFSVVRSYLLKAVIFFTAFLLPALFYYVPFYFGQAFEDQTSDYLGNRLFGGGFMPRTEITNDLITMYIPEYHLNFLFVAGLLGILFNYKHIVGFKFSKIKFSKKSMQIIFTALISIILAATIFSFYPIKPRSASLLVIGSSIAMSVLLMFYNRIKWDRAAVITWFLGTYAFYFFIMKDPRTHVYVSILPLFIIAGYGIAKAYRSIASSVLKNVAIILIILSFFFISGVNWMIFVDKNPEYPWFDKDFLGWPIYRIERVRHQKKEGAFGFNNYRGWEKIADLYNKGCLTGGYNSNEKDSITYFYIRQHQQKGQLQEFKPEGDNLLIIEGPHSWEYYNPNNLDMSKYVLLGQVDSGNYTVTRIYGKTDLYPEGKFLCNQ